MTPESTSRGERGQVTHGGLPAAYISADGRYRYDLLRQWGPDDGPQVCWVMLNPSTADATQDDPTIRRCIGFSKAWGFDSLIVVNLFALRSTDPKALFSADVSPIGPENDDCIDRAVRNAQRVVCAWGTKGVWLGRASRVTQRLTGMGYTLDALAITKDGHPKHPLYVRADTIPAVYRPGLVAASGSGNATGSSS